jgi:hypothetical protein
MSKKLLNEIKKLEMLISIPAKNDMEIIENSICQKYCVKIKKILEKMEDIEKIENLKNYGAKIEIINSLYCNKDNKNCAKCADYIFELLKNIVDDEKSCHKLFIYECEDDKIFLHYCCNDNKPDCLWTKYYPIKKLLGEKKININIAIAIYSQLSQKMPNIAFFQNDFVEKNNNEKKYKTSYDYSSDSEEDNELNDKILDLIKKTDEIVPKKKNNLSQRTITLHETSLKMLKQKANIEEKDYDNSDHVIKTLQDLKNDGNLSNALIKNYIDSINWYLNENFTEFTEKQKYSYIMYKEYSCKLQKKYNNFLIDGNMTEKNKILHMKKDDLILMVENAKNLASSLDFLVMKMYIEFPRRLDLLNLVYLTNYKDQKNYEKVNFYIKNGNERRFLFLEFKNKKETKIFDKIFSPSAELSKILDEYIDNNKIKNGDRIFEEKYFKNGSDFLQNIFSKYLGKKISVNALRHIFASDDPIDNKDLKDISKKMAHSVEMHLLYKRKK